MIGGRMANVPVHPQLRRLQGQLGADDNETIMK